MANTILPCRKCQNLSTPTIMLARRTSDKLKSRHYGLVGCEHARELAEWNYPPHGFHNDYDEMVLRWNEAQDPKQH